METVADCRRLSSHRRRDEIRQFRRIGVGGVNHALLRFVKDTSKRLKFGLEVFFRSEFLVLSDSKFQMIF